MTCCEYAYLILGSALSETFPKVRPQVDACSDVLELALVVSGGDMHRELEPLREVIRESRGLTIFSVHTMSERLIQVENQCFALSRRDWWW